MINKSIIQFLGWSVIWYVNTLTKLRYSATAERAATESFLAASSQTQQCTPLRPEYTHRRWWNPKSSETHKQHKFVKFVHLLWCSQNCKSSVDKKLRLPRSARSRIRIAMVIRVQHFEQISAALKNKKKITAFKAILHKMKEAEKASEYLQQRLTSS